MFRNARLMGVVLWLFSFQVFAFTSGGLLAKHLWLDMGTVVLMFTIASYMLGLSLTGSSEGTVLAVMMLIVVASAMMTARFCGQLAYHWYDLMTVVAAPQVMAMAIGLWLANRRQSANTQLSC